MVELAEVLADLARGKLRKKLADLRQVLAGRFRPHHAGRSGWVRHEWRTLV